MVARGEIWLAALDPTVGTEIQKTRPVLVVSPDDLNRHLRLVTIVPLTSGSWAAAFRVPIRFQEKDGFVLLEQIRAIDRRRLIKPLGSADADILKSTLLRLRELFSE